MVPIRQFFSHRLIWLALLVALGIGTLFARTIWTQQPKYLTFVDLKAELVDRGIAVKALAELI